MAQTSNPLARHGGLSYLEIPTREPHRSGAFYEQLLGWTTDARGLEDLRFADGSGLLIGRFVPGRPPSSTPTFLPYFYVASLEAALGRVPELGGRVVEPSYAEGNLLVARVADPAGNVIGLWQFA